MRDSIRFDADPKDATAIGNLQNATHAVDRFEWERAGEKGHFPAGIPDYLWTATGIATLKDRASRTSGLPSRRTTSIKH